MSILKKAKELGMGTLMLGASASALFAGSESENYDVTPDNFHETMMATTLGKSIEERKISELSMGEKQADKMYYIAEKTMQARGMDKVDPTTVFQDSPEKEQVSGQYKMLEKEFGSQTEAFYKARATYFKIWEKSGKPTLATKEKSAWTTQVFSTMEGTPNRAKYNSLINEIYNPKETYKDQMAEMAHAYYQQRSSQFWSIAGDWILHPGVDQNETYNRVDLTEFNTHECIEPVLKDCVSGKIPFDHVDQEIDRRFVVSEKLAEAGIHRISQEYAQDIIGDISDELAKKDYFKDGGKVFSSGDRCEKDDSFNTFLKIPEKNGHISDEKFVYYQLEQLKSGRIDGEGFFSGLKKMKETLHKIQDDKELSEIARVNVMNAEDVAMLSDLEGLNKTIESFKEPFQYFTEKEQKEIFANSPIFTTDMTKLTPESLEAYFFTAHIGSFGADEKVAQSLETKDQKNTSDTVTQEVSKKDPIAHPKDSLKSTLAKASEAGNATLDQPQKSNAGISGLSVAGILKNSGRA